MIIDPDKMYAELGFGTNVVERVFSGSTVQGQVFGSDRKIIEVPIGMTVLVGYIYSNGSFVAAVTPLTIQESLVRDVQEYMDVRARERGYDSIFTAVTYADEPTVTQFQLEGQAYRAWRSQVWAYCYAQLSAVQLGEREVPTSEQLISELPALILP